VFDPTQVTSPGNYSNPKPGDPCHPLAAGAYVPLIIGALSDGAHHGGGLNGQDAYSGRIIAPVGLVRRLTPTECERLQGFPDGWTDVPSTIQRKAGPVVKPAADSHRYRQLGNAVAVPVAEWLAKRIMAVS
jgi:DNA (cytosine-5)-methyltransferase 1